MRARSFSHAGITVSDFNRAVQFYWDVFGCPLVGVADTPSDRVRTFFGVHHDQPSCKIGWIRVPGGGVLEIFEFQPQQPPRSVPWNGVGLTHISFNVKNLQKWHDYLQRKGVEIISKPERSPRGHSFFFVKDFDGNLIELMDLGYMYHVLNWLGPLGGWIFRRGMYKQYTNKENNSMRTAVAALLLATLSGPLFAQSSQTFEIDPYWPKPLPDKWIIGRTGSICADAHDHLVVTNRRDITAEEAETSLQAPSVLIFDREGNLVHSFGDSNTVPGVIHGCFVDHEHNIWVTGNGDGIIQKWSHEGKLLLQIGKRGVFDTSDGTAKGERLNAGHAQFFNPAGIVVDPSNGDVYVADGYGNRRVAVFDRQGQFLRQWGRQATKEETESGAGGAFAQIVHCIAMSRAGLIYVCDRQGDRVQVFDKAGTFVRNIWIRTGTPALPDPRGTAWWVAFSRDPEQRFMYVMNGRNEQLHILDHASGRILSSFGRPGHWLGNFTHGHAVAVDSSGNLYIAETDTGRRMQKFRLVGKQ